MGSPCSEPTVDAAEALVTALTDGHILPELDGGAARDHIEAAEDVLADMEAPVSIGGRGVEQKKQKQA